MPEQEENSILPRYEELDSEVYSKILQQLQTQSSTINLLHLQLKKGNQVAGLDEVDEKDRIIRSLEKEVDRLNASGGSNTDHNELEEEVYQLSQQLRMKNQNLRELERKYNEHLNRMHEEIEELKNTGGNSADSSNEGALKTELANLKEELHTAKQQVEFHQNRASVPSLSDQEVQELKDSLKDSQNQVEESGKRENQLSQELIRTREELETLKIGQSNPDYSRIQEAHSKEVTQLKLEISDLLEQVSQLKSGSSKVPSEGLNLEQLNLFIKFYRLVEKDRDHTEDPTWISLQKSLRALLEEIGLQPFEDLGQEFNEERHHLHSEVFSTEHPHQSILITQQCGFLLHGNVFCKANVILSKNPAHCQACGFESQVKGKFCSECGSRLQIDVSAQEDLLLDEDQNARAYLKLAQRFFDQRRFLESRDHYLKAYTIAPDLSHAALGAAKCLECLGSFDEALNELKVLENDVSVKVEVGELEGRILRKKRILTDIQELY